ncbi:MAG: hypothetical protein GY788_15805 [bacterium]|nr:hypothetical protein [bacterium]
MSNLEFSEYRKWYEACAPFREVIILADCCRTPSSKTVGGGPVFEWCDRGIGPVTLGWGYATARGDAAFEEVVDDELGSPEDERSYFTRALIDGLRGAAERNPQTLRIDSMTLGSYIKQRVTQDTKEKPVPQDASFYAAEPIAFGAAAPPEMVRDGALEAIATPLWKVTVTFGPAVEGQVRLLDGNLVQRAAWDTADGPWQLPLTKGLWSIETENGTHATTFKVIGGEFDVRLL